MIDYLMVLTRCFPTAEAYVLGSGSATNYDDLIWITPQIDKATLDASYCASDGYGYGDPPITSEIRETGMPKGLYYGAIPTLAGTSSFSGLSTTPLVTEGSPLWTCTLTPATPNSVFKINFSITIDVSRSLIMAVAVFRDSTLIGSGISYCSGSDKPASLHIQYVDKPRTASPVVYQARVGKSDGRNGTWYVNGTPSYNFGNSLDQRFTIMEYE